MKRLLLLLPVILVACGSQLVEFPEGSGAAPTAPPVDEPCDCPPAPVELCTNGVDDDGDGLVDCADPDCDNDPACATLVLTPPEKIGTPPVEDAGTPPVEDSGTPPVEQCTNGVDDDGDQLVDCADPDCAQNEACLPTPPPPPPAENCSNGKDDDGDELVDCADPDCANDRACSPPPPVDAGPPPDLCSSDAPKTCEDALHCCMNTCKPLVQGCSKHDHDDHVSCVQNCANEHKVCVKKRQCSEKREHEKNHSHE